GVNAMTRTIIALAVFAATLTPALVGTAHALSFHYACQSGEDRYALTVNTDRSVVTMTEKGPPHSRTTFRILKVNPDCGKTALPRKDSELLIGTDRSSTATKPIRSDR